MSEKTKKFLRVLEVSEPNKDGVFIHVRGLANYLIEAGHKLTYAYSDKRCASQLAVWLSELEKNGISTKNLRVGNAPCLRDLAAVAWIVWNIHKTGADIVHGHSSKGGALIRLVAAILPGPVYIYTPHAYYSMAQRPSGVKIGYWWLERLLAPLAVTINISRDERLFGIKNTGLNQHKACIAHNPVDLDKFRVSDVSSRQELRTRWGLPKDAVVFGTLARFGAQKDLNTFYAAAILCAKKNKNVHFFHLGAGKEVADCIEKINMAGVRSQFTHIDYLEDTAPFYACLDAFVITSRFEAGWPIVMLEALAAGLPLVSTRFVGINAKNPKELSHATLVSVGDVDELAVQLMMLAETLAVKAISTNHRAYVEANFAPKVCYGMVETIYQTLTARRPVV